MTILHLIGTEYDNRHSLILIKDRHIFNKKYVFCVKYNGEVIIYKLIIIVHTLYSNITFIATE